MLLAPMEDVSDPPFRALCKEQGADVVYTEFISSEGLIRDAAKSVMKLDIYEKERPVGIQIFGAVLESMLKSVEIVEASGPDIIDINFDEGLLESKECMIKFLNLISTEPEVAKVPVMIDSSDWSVIEAGIKCACGSFSTRPAHKHLVAVQMHL